MGERKAQNKYYPPDFDPSKLLRQPKNKPVKVRMMLPMSIRCNTCGNYNYKGTKFNSRKEVAIGEAYLGIQKFRFYFKCYCSAKLPMKTNPQNADYIVESGATRNFEPWRAQDEETDNAQRKRDSEEMGDAMKALENRTLDSKREMVILASLDEMKSMKSRQANVSIDDMLAALQNKYAEKEKRLEEEDENFVKSIFNRPKTIMKRIYDEDFDLESSRNGLKKRKVSGEFPTDILANASIHTNKENSSDQGNAKPKTKTPSIIVNVVKKPVITYKKPEEEKKPENTSTGLQSLFQSYEDDD